MDKTSAKDLPIIINGCVNGMRNSQKDLYDLICSEMFSACVANCKNSKDAEEVLTKGFINLFNNIHKYSFQESFSDWCKAFFIESSLKHYERTNAN